MWKLLKDIFGLFFPEICLACRQNLNYSEHTFCIGCKHDFPYTAFHEDPANPMSRQLWGRFRFESAAALLYFKKGGVVQRLIHQLKYRGRTEVGEVLGEIYGRSLCSSTNYRMPDHIVPVPLHPSKQRKRGYNQSEFFARGLSKTMKIPMSATKLRRKTATESQTFKNRFMRFENMREIFTVDDPSFFRGKHICLADDVLTTGSTAEACAIELLKIEGTTVSILTIAYAE